MNSRLADKRVDLYLKRLDAALRDLPRARRREIMADLEGHIAEARAGLRSDADVLNMLDRLGDPDDIAAEARERLGTRRRRAGATEIWALICLLPGSLIIPVVGWVVGVILLWISNVWTTRDKLFGTLIWPGGLGGAFFLGTFPYRFTSCVGSRASCSPDPSGIEQLLAILPFAAILVAPLVVVGYLIWRLRRVPE